MNCPRCGNITNLKQSWGMDCTVKRFRVCPKCGHRSFTYEIPEQHLEGAAEYIEKVNRG